MARYLMIALNGPTAGEGDEETYNRWYDEVHLPDLRSVPGITSARRYRIVRGMIPGLTEMWPYAAVYEIETDDMAAVSKGMQAQLRPFDPTFDRSRSGHLMLLEITEEE